MALGLLSAMSWADRSHAQAPPGAPRPASPASSLPLAPSPAPAADAPAHDVDDPVCWAPPALALKRDSKKRLSDAMNDAAKLARPERSLRPIMELASSKSLATAELECAVVVATVLDASKKTWTLSLELRGARTATAAVQLDPRSYTSAALTPAWTRLWRVIDPPPPPAPPKAAEPPPPPERDADLAHEQALARPRAAEPTPPRLRLWLTGGLALRDASATRGTTLEHGPLMALGGEATLHLGSWISPGIALDLSAAYARRLAKVVVADVSSSADADRFDATLSFRYVFGERGPSLGPQLGWQVLRFELEPSTGLLSTRYGVLRAGLEARVPLAEWLELSAQGALRIAPDGGTDLGFDVAGGPELLLGELALVRAWARYAQQTGPEFEDRQLDVELALGVRL